jgi:hypothetical protein
MKTTQAWGWLAAGVLALGLNGVYQDGGVAWAHRVLNGTIGRFAARSEAVLALATGRVDLFAEKASAPRIETASCRVASAFSRIQSKIHRARTQSHDFEVTTAAQDIAMAHLDAQRDRMEAQRDRIEARVERVQFVPVALDNLRISVPACARARVNLPRVNVPNSPMELTSPMVKLDMPGSGPI